MFGIAGMGILAYRALPVSDLPNVDFPTLNVGAGLPGADPGTMASAVASPLERQFTTIAGLEEMTSSSSTGSTNVTLQFDLDRNIDSAAVDVETAVAAVMPLLPSGMPAPPSFRKFNPADSPIMYFALTSKTVPMSTLDDYAENVDRAAYLDGQRRVTGAGPGGTEVRRPRPGRSDQTAGGRHRAERSQPGDPELERQPADRPAVRRRRPTTSRRPVS